MFFIFLLARTLSQPAKEVTGNKTPELNKPDLVAYTRIIGGITIDTTALNGIPSEFRRQLIQIDTMLSNRELRDAIARLTKLQRKASPLVVAATQGYIGFCYNELVQPTAALAAFQQGLQSIDTTAETGIRLFSWLAFNAGYLFQYYGIPESAIKYYQRSWLAVSRIPAPSFPPFTGALLNNLGVATEMIGDTTAAKTFYLRAAAYIDTSAGDRTTQRLKENLRRWLK